MGGKRKAAKQKPISEEEAARAKEARERKKAAKKARYEERLVAQENRQREAQQRLEGAHSMHSIRTFIFYMGDMPWSGPENNWGFGTDIDLTVPVPPPDNILEKVNEISLQPNFTYVDLATAVQDAAIKEGCGGNIYCAVKVEPGESETSLKVEFKEYRAPKD